MRAFIDTNVIVDVVAHREPFFSDSQAVLALCALAEIEGVVSDLTFCNVAYIMRKQLGKTQLIAGLNALRKIVSIVPVGGESAISSALENEAIDFEDAVQLIAAVACSSDVIITRNARHFVQSPIRVCSPADFLATR